MSAHPAPPESPSRWTAGRVVLVVLGSIAALIGAGLLAAGIGVLWADQTQREDGYLSTPTETFAVSTHAIVSERIDLVEADNEAGRWALSEGVLGDVRVTADGENDVFVGVAPTRDVEAYLNGVAFDTVEDVRYDPFRVDYARAEGTETPAPPADQDFWVASASGDGAQAATWDVKPGAWSVVVMNADASAGVTADITAGAEARFLIWLALGLLLAGLVFLAGGSGMIYGGARHAAAQTTATGARSGRGVRADGLPGRRRGRASAGCQPLALARQVAPRHPALHRARVPLDRVLDPDARRGLRDPLHGPLPARDLRLQRRRPALDVARLVLLVLGERHRSLPAVLARRGAGLPGAAPHPLPRAAEPLALARQVAPRHPAPDPGRPLRRRLGLGLPERTGPPSASPVSSGSSS